MSKQMNKPPAGLHWYLIKTKPRSEEKAQNFLTFHGINTFLPWMEFFHNNGTNTVKPLFPNYLFAQFDLTVSFPLVKWGRGINTIIGFGNYPTPLANEVISIIKNRTDENNVVNRAYKINKNDPVIVTSGPLKNLMGIFDRWISESGRVRILLNLVGYQPHVDLHYSQLDKVYP